MQIYVRNVFEVVHNRFLDTMKFEFSISQQIMIVVYVVVCDFINCAFASSDSLFGGSDDR